MSLSQYTAALEAELWARRKARFQELLPESNGQAIQKQRAAQAFMLVTLIAAAISIFVQHKLNSQQKRAHVARQKISKNKYYVYINNYDDIEFNEKVRKVQDADRQNIHLNHEDDLANLNRKNRRRFSPLSRYKPRRHSHAGREEYDPAPDEFAFSDIDGDNLTESLDGTEKGLEPRDQAEVLSLENFQYMD